MHEPTSDDPRTQFVFGVGADPPSPPPPPQLVNITINADVTVNLNIFPTLQSSRIIFAVLK